MVLFWIWMAVFAPPCAHAAALNYKEAGSGSPVSNTGGLNLVIYKDARVATGFVTLDVTTNLPKLEFDIQNSGAQTCKFSANNVNDMCAALNAVDKTSYEILVELKNLFVKSDDLVARRAKRQAVLPFLGTFSKWLSGTVVEEDLDKVITRVNEIGHAVNSNFGRQTNFENTTTQNFVQLHSMSEKIDKNVRELAAHVNGFNAAMAKHASEGDIIASRLVLQSALSTKISLLLTHLATLRALHASCHDNKMSHIAVSVDQLKKIVQKAAVEIARKNIRFVLDLNRVEAIYSFPTTQCRVSPDYSTLTMTLSLPVAPLTTSYTVAEFLPLDFLHRGLTCRIIEDAVRLAIGADGVAVPLPGGPVGNPPVFLLPRHASPAQLSPCLRSIAKNDDAEGLVAACVLHCEQRAAPTVQHIREDIFNILNSAEEIQLICQNKVQHRLPRIQEGRHQVKVPCGCLAQTSTATPETIVDSGVGCNESSSSVSVSSRWAGAQFSAYSILGVNVTSANFTPAALPPLRIITPPPPPSGTFWDDLPLSGMSHTEFWLWTAISTVLSAAAVFGAVAAFCPTSTISSSLSVAGMFLRALSCCRKSIDSSGTAPATPPVDSTPPQSGHHPEQAEGGSSDGQASAAPLTLSGALSLHPDAVHLHTRFG